MRFSLPGEKVLLRVQLITSSAPLILVVYLYDLVWCLGLSLKGFLLQVHVHLEHLWTRSPL